MTTIVTPASERIIRVGLTELHGRAQEMQANPPPCVEYRPVETIVPKLSLIRNVMKGGMHVPKRQDVDLVEGILGSVFTENRWLHSLSCFQNALAWEGPGLPIPRQIRSRYMQRLYRRENFRRMIFLSEAGRRTLESYGRVTDPRILDKVTVVYPGVQMPPPPLPADEERKSIRCLFSGEFFRKGGPNVIDAFLVAQRRIPELELIVCCDEHRDFGTDSRLAALYLDKIRRNESIRLVGRVSRQRFLDEFMVRADILLLPSYSETFGFVLLEAMARRVPVIATNVFAIPEIVEDGRTGFLIDMKKFDLARILRGYSAEGLPAHISAVVTEQLTDYMVRLATSEDMRLEMGERARSVAATKFSMSRWQSTMRKIYEDAVG